MVVGERGCQILYNESEDFQVGLDLIYALCLVPVEDSIRAWEEVVEVFFEQKDFGEDSAAVEDFTSYVERIYIGAVNPRTGIRKAVHNSYINIFVNS